MQRIQQAGNVAAVIVLACVLSACSSGKTAGFIVDHQVDVEAIPTYVVSISSDDKIEAGGVHVPLSDLSSMLAEQQSARPDIAVVLRAHMSSSNLILVQVMDAARRAGVTNIRVETMGNAKDSP